MPNLKNIFSINQAKLLLPYLAYFFLVIGLLHQGLFQLGSGMIIGGDSPTADGAAQFFPMWFFTHQSLRDGIIPLWNPYLLCGTPFLASLQPAIFYPPNLILGLCFSPSISLNLSIALHLFLGMVFTFGFLRELKMGRLAAFIAGIVFVFSATTILRVYAGHLTIVSALCWTPFQFKYGLRLFEQKSVTNFIGLVLGIALQLLAGQPQFVYYSVLALSFYMLYFAARSFRENKPSGTILVDLLIFAGAVVSAVAVTAVQLLPTLELSLLSTRSSGGYEWVKAFSFPWQNLVTMIIPDAFGNVIDIPYWGESLLWESSCYVGIVTLILVFVGLLYSNSKQRWFWMGLGLVALLFSLGRYTPFLWICFYLLPGIGSFRGHCKAMFLFVFAVAVLAAFGIDRLQGWFQDGEEKNDTRSIVMVKIGLLVGTLVLGMTFIFINSGNLKELVPWAVARGAHQQYLEFFCGEEFLELALQTMRKSLTFSLVFLTVFAILFWLAAKKIVPRNLLLWSAVALLTIDLALFAIPFMTTFDSKSLFLEKNLADYFASQPRPFRVVTPRSVRNTVILDKLEKPTGNETIFIRHYSEFLNASQRFKPDLFLQNVVISKFNRMTDLMNITHVILPVDVPVKSSRLKPVLSGEKHRVYQVVDSLPRAIIVNGTLRSVNRNQIFSDMLDGEFNPLNYAYVEVPEAEMEPSSQDGSSVVWEQNDTEKQRLIVECDNPGFLVVSDTWYPGWQAFVDGTPQQIFRANYAFRGIKVPAGKHKIEFRFKSKSFIFGAWISIVSLVLMVGLTVIWKLKIPIQDKLMSTPVAK